jgi:hypothetical protein
MPTGGKNSTENARILRGGTEIRNICFGVSFDAKRIWLLNYLKEEFGRTRQN